MTLADLSNAELGARLARAQGYLEAADHRIIIASRPYNDIYVAENFIGSTWRPPPNWRHYSHEAVREACGAPTREAILDALAQWDARLVQRAQQMAEADRDSVLAELGRRYGAGK